MVLFLGGITIRQEHENGNRQGKAHFYIIANNQFGITLMKEIEEKKYGDDTFFLNPSNSDLDDFNFPNPTETIEELFEKCCQLAGNIQLGALSAETVVHKLASIIMQTATGGFNNADHVIKIEDFSTIVEQIIVQLQAFPTITEKYRPHKTELDFISQNRVRIIKGFSGVGKTTWASYYATFSPELCNYFDVTDIPGDSFFKNLAREIIAKYAIKNTSKILLLSNSGLDMIRQLDKQVEEEQLLIQVVLDNVHATDSKNIATLINNTNYLKFILMGQPKGDFNSLVTELVLEVESLDGWGKNEVEAEIRENNIELIGVTPTSIQRLLDITGGLPLFVKSAIKLSYNQFNNNLEKLCSALETQTHLEETQQEALLRRIFASLSNTSKNILAILACSYSLTRNEIQQIISSFELPKISLGLRELIKHDAVAQLSNQKIKIHDAMKLIAKEHFENYSSEEKSRIKIALKEVLLASFEKELDFRNLYLYFKLLVELKEIDVLADLGTDEIFHELGFPTEMWELLKQVVNDESIEPKIRFDALDTLIFNEVQNSDDYQEAQIYLDLMKKLVNESNLNDDHQKLKYLMKQMRVSAYLNNRSDFENACEESKLLVPDDFKYKQVYKYEIACCYFQFNDYEKVMREMHQYIRDYYDSFNITSNEIERLSLDAIRQKLTKNGAFPYDFKHIADALVLLAKTGNKLQIHNPKFRLHASVFYQSANALDSYVVTTQDLADDYLAINDLQKAKVVMETGLLPNLENGLFMDRYVAIKCQYAVILAWCGECYKAGDIFNALNFYRNDLSDLEKEEFDNQKQLFLNICHGS